MYDALIVEVEKYGSKDETTRAQGAQMTLDQASTEALELTSNLRNT